MKKWKDGNDYFSINYHIYDESEDSTLLRQIATEGGGMHSFIPDSGFVGTAFVNSLAKKG